MGNDRWERRWWRRQEIWSELRGAIPKHPLLVHRAVSLLVRNNWRPGQEKDRQVRREQKATLRALIPYLLSTGAAKLGRALDELRQTKAEQSGTGLTSQGVRNLNGVGR